MISIKKPRKRIHADYSDILFGHDFLHEIRVKIEKLEGQKAVAVPWDMGFSFLAPHIDVKEWAAACVYQCPYIEGNRFFWMYPLAILTEDETRYGVDANSRDFSKRPWLVKVIKVDATDIDEYDCELHKDLLSLMGHGYTDFTLPSDGSRSLVHGTVLLDNGDRILVACWLWHNK